MLNAENKQPSRLRRISAAAAGVGTAAAIYAAEACLAYAIAEKMKAGFQSPDTFSNTVSLLVTLGIAVIGLYDLAQNRADGAIAVVTSGARAGLAVNQEIIEA